MYESTNPKLLQQKLRTIISSMNDKDAPKLLEKFMQFGTQKIEINSKEISYKCYEAVCSMKSKKATGYGKSESEALGSAIRNLFENLLDDEKYLYIIKQAIKKNIQFSQHIHTEEDKENSSMSKFQIQINKKTGTKKPPIYNSFMNNSNYLNLSLNDQISKSKSKIGIQNLNISSIKFAQNNHNKSQDKDFVSNNIDEQLKRAKQYIKQLQGKLKLITDQNKTMKQQLLSENLVNSKILDNNNKDFPINDKLRSTSYQHQNKTNLLNTSQHNHSIFEINNSLNKSTIEEKKKNSKVPRLKLQILPNYHGKSNKCLNQVLLAAYQQKQAAKKY